MGVCAAVCSDHRLRLTTAHPPPPGAGFDQALNVILEECFERVFSTDMGMEQNPLGLYIIRGDNMCVFMTPVRTGRYLTPRVPCV